MLDIQDIFESKIQEYLQVIAGLQFPSLDDADYNVEQQVIHALDESTETAWHLRDTIYRDMHERVRRYARSSTDNARD
jgi:hypothetical protein